MLTSSKLDEHLKQMQKKRVQSSLTLRLVVHPVSYVSIHVFLTATLGLLKVMNPTAIKAKPSQQFTYAHANDSRMKFFS